MRITEIEQKKHPFNYAYPPQDNNDIASIKQAYAWVVKEYKVNAPMPEMLIANHEHMQRAAAKAHHNTILSGQVFGWYSQQHKMVYLSDRLHPGRNKTHAAVLVHEFVHYLQDVAGKDGDVASLEEEADKFMHAFLIGR